MLEKVISGGQTGADQAGLEAAKHAGFQTGGTAPPNFMTDEGSAPWLADRFGLKEGQADPKVYPKRTLRNVLDSDATFLWGNVGSPGCRLTIKYCEMHNKPYFCHCTSAELADHIIQHDFKVINIAGNRERTNPGIHAAVYESVYFALLYLDLTYRNK